MESTQREGAQTALTDTQTSGAQVAHGRPVDICTYPIRSKLNLRAVEPPPCETCWYYTRSGNELYCGHPERTSIFRNRTERSGSCGIEGRLWEAKDPLVSPLVKTGEGV